MDDYFVTIPITLTDEQREAVEERRVEDRGRSEGRRDGRRGADDHDRGPDDSPEQAASVVAEAFGLDPDEVRVEER